jgi:primosomal protein N' (replication factor Y)
LNLYAEIALPTPLRKTFTYRVPDELQHTIEAGKRVWVDFNFRKSIGMVVGLHEHKPDYETKNIDRLLDEDVLISPRMMELLQWMSRFYYCGFGEVIQAALPSGLNYLSKAYVYLTHDTGSVKLTEKEKMLMETLSHEDKIPLREFEQRFKNTSSWKTVQSLRKKGLLETREEPEIKVSEKKIKMWEWTDTAEVSLEIIEGHIRDSSKVYKWMEAGKRLSDIELPQAQSKLIQEFNFSAHELKRLEKEGIIRSFEGTEDDEFLPYSQETAEPYLLNEEQQKAFVEIAKNLNTDTSKAYLLHGVTGSGKTEVYIHLLREALQSGKTGMVLVPEIALTPQFLHRFSRVFGEQLTIYHSRLSDRERKNAWQQVHRGEKKIVIGTRSAVFMPLKDPALIILDEEHDHSYKQEDPAPRYHAREVAMMRAQQPGAVIVLGSATPSMQAMQLAREGKLAYLRLNQRHSEATLPEVEIIDLTQYRSAMRGPLAVPLFNAVEEALWKKEQVILLQNRRGFSNYLQCMNCGHIPQSPETSVSLTYHKHKNMLLCHYSGYSRRADTECEECGSKDLQAKGTGTQKIEEEISALFPDAGILRMDRDTTTGKDGHSKIIRAFERQEADILLGTQLVTKGLDFPNVTVVGVIDADTELAFPSFQSEERSFQMLNQVSGRAGRSSKKGRVFIQTRQADHPSFRYIKLHDYSSFAEEELKFRENLNYPPFSRLVGIVFKSRKDSETKRAAFLFTDLLRKAIDETMILGPSPSALHFLNGQYYWESSIKLPINKGARFVEHLFDTIFSHYEKSKPPSSVRININVGKVN